MICITDLDVILVQDEDIGHQASGETVMTLKCKDFVVLVRYDNPLAAGALWFVLNRFTNAAAAWTCLNEQLGSGKVARMGRL